MEMAAWKALVAGAVQSGSPLELEFFGGANQITGYRIYYMLQFAKRAGVPHLTLRSDGVFWIDEATDWLVESGVDEIVLEVPGGKLPQGLADKVDGLSARGLAVPVVTVRPVRG
jgi:hypothetical protein